MSEMLSKALSGLGLLPGQTYRATVDGHVVEVRVLAEDDAPTPELAEQVMLQPWVGEFPYPTKGVTVRARPGQIELSPPPDIPTDEGEG
jgi:hypothetical protein